MNEQISAPEGNRSIDRAKGMRGTNHEQPLFPQTLFFTLCSLVSTFPYHSFWLFS